MAGTFLEGWNENFNKRTKIPTKVYKKNTFVNFITLHSTGKKKEKKIHYKIIIKLLLKK